MKKNVNEKNNTTECIDSIAIMAGQGYLPRELYDTCVKRGIRVEVIRLDEKCPDKIFTDVKTHCMPVHAVSDIVNTIKSHNISHIAMAGYVKRASIPRLIFDIKGAKLLAKIIKQGFSDAALITAMLSFLENEGFTIVPPEEIATDIIASKGNMTTTVRITKANMEDITAGVKSLKGMSQFDAGQALVIQNGLILGVEAVEGTDALVQRCGAIKQKFGTEPVLVKICKPHQDRRVDLPCIGDNTIENLKKCGIKGVAIQAGAAFIIHRKKAIEIAAANDIFIYGYEI